MKEKYKKEFICEVCNKKFLAFPWNRRGKYITCSSSCYGKISMEILKGRSNFWLKNNIPWNKGIKNPNISGDKHPRWKGKVKHGRGYVWAYVQNHPFSTQNSEYGGYVLEHRLVMEKHLGRYLNPGEKVHHLDGNPSNNKIENLILFSNHSTHMRECHLHDRDNLGRFIKHDLQSEKSDIS